MKVKQLLTRTTGALGVTAGLLFAGSPLMAQVKIGDNPNTVNSSSILELESATKGLRLPRVELQSLSNPAPLAAHVLGMHVYNTTDNATLQAGEYYNDGTSWIALSSDIAFTYIDGINAPTGSCAAKTIYTDTLEASGTYGQQWRCINGSWVDYVSPTKTPFYAGTTTRDAGGNRSGLISRSGNVLLRRADNQGSTTLVQGGMVRLYRNASVAPAVGASIDFARNTANPALFRVGLRNDLNDSQGALAFQTNLAGTTSTRMLIGLNGQVGINTTNPLRVFHVNGKALFSNNNNDGALYFNGTADQDGILLDWDDNAKEAQIAVQTDGPNLALTKKAAPAGSVFVVFRANGDDLGQIRYNGTQTVYAVTSDSRLKENVKQTHYSIEDLMKIGVVDYNYKNNAAKTRTTGFIAQDLFKIFPDAVSKGGDDVKTNPWMVDYGKLTPLLVKAIQDQQKKIESLEAQLSEMNALKAEVASIKAMLGNAEQQKSGATTSK
ncbi:hypothetical protein GCM10010967_32350 [Dyadobacter beijingensis]|uniref:Peptidase S74 domain-containing protein n=1 Tax=Dyadobacter beijingensis TaxID=365489 RepID=A0ABQ2HZM3_9BACT|nr:tail fiber domain-containing protein [Dyadobacter beijingensis]GGM96295.1 hypothetical protein GCM10010967_32350 [Dyadobacter beijingensis]